MLDVQQVAIVGTGLLGGSIGLALRAAGFRGRIVGVGRRREPLARAVELGCVDTATQDVGEAARDSGLVVLATPLRSFKGLLAELAGHDHPGLYVTDVGSTKQRVCAEAQRLLPHPERFVGSHPMAGSERQGPEAARPDLFRGKPCVVTPGPGSAAQAVRVVRSLWETLGMRLIEMDPAEHDRRVAAVSHLPHAAAVSLVLAADRLGGMEIASTGFGDGTRVASGDPSVWADVFMTNREAVAAAIDRFIQELSGFREAVAAGREEQVFDLLQRGKALRDRWWEGFSRSSEPSA